MTCTNTMFKSCSANLQIKDSFFYQNEEYEGYKKIKWPDLMFTV